MAKTNETKSRGMVFTIDALFSLGLFAVVALSFAAFFQYSPHFQRLAGLQSLGRDFLSLNNNGYPVDADGFRALTGLKISTSSSGAQSGADIAVRSTLYSYPRLCRCPSSSECLLGLGAADSKDCLSAQETGRAGYFFKNESWVYAP